MRLRNAARNVMEDNKDMSRHLPEKRAVAIAESIANRERQFSNVLENRKEITEETHQRRLAIVYRKEIEAAQEEEREHGEESKYVNIESGGNINSFTEDNMS